MLKLTTWCVCASYNLMLVFQSLEVDAEATIDLINYAYFKRVVQKPKKKQDNRVDEEDGTQSKK